LLVLYSALGCFLLVTHLILPQLSHIIQVRNLRLRESEVNSLPNVKQQSQDSSAACQSSNILSLACPWTTSLAKTPCSDGTESPLQGEWEQQL
jgi:hypothetical protein